MTLLFEDSQLGHELLSQFRRTEAIYLQNDQFFQAVVINGKPLKYDKRERLGEQARAVFHFQPRLEDKLQSGAYE